MLWILLAFQIQFHIIYLMSLNGGDCDWNFHILGHREIKKKSIILVSELLQIEFMSGGRLSEVKTSSVSVKILFSKIDRTSFVFILSHQRLIHVEKSGVTICKDVPFALNVEKCDIEVFKKHLSADDTLC
mmetsp:Transcript_8360/g.11935  ORF Transcript_8360/g.11935 Transcript_8360/m.11935 type:complete len:130 (+) Transcript_8360:409-798(+)